MYRVENTESTKNLILSVGYKIGDPAHIGVVGVGNKPPLTYVMKTTDEAKPITLHIALEVPGSR
ncbi:MAG: hypothetical protein QXF79_02190 [Ignisphaera sp.]